MSIPTPCPSTPPNPESQPEIPGASPRPTTAVVPAAGWGTRLRPLTDAIPKEMMPVGSRVALDRIVDEMTAAGMKRIVFVLSSAKEALIHRYFGESREGVQFFYALQPEMRGLGDAVLCAEPFCVSGEPFVIALGDAVYEEARPGAITTRLANSFAAAKDATVAVVVQKLPRERISKYGVVKPRVGTDGLAFEIDDIVEKPSAEEAPSEYAVAARFVATTAIFDILRHTAPGKGGEIQLTDALRVPLSQGACGIAVPLISGEIRHDIGSLESYFKAFAAFALLDSELGAGFQAFVRNRLQDDRKDSGQ